MLSREAERDRQIGTLRSAAYSDYLRALVASKFLASDQDLVGVLRTATDAKARIVVYGTSRVVGALAHFEEMGASIHDDKGMESFTSLILAMRESKDATADRDIRLVLFGSDK